MRGGLRGAHSFRHLFENPGLIATLAGILIACLWPRASQIAGTAPTQALAMIGSMTVPLSLVVTGAQLGDVKLDGRFERSLVGVLLTRLIVAPLLIGGMIILVPGLAADVKMVLTIIACMPVGASCALFLERFGGDHRLAAKAITLSTLLSLITLPAMLWLLVR